MSTPWTFSDLKGRIKIHPIISTVQLTVYDTSDCMFEEGSENMKRNEPEGQLLATEEVCEAIRDLKEGTEGILIFVSGIPQWGRG